MKLVFIYLILINAVGFVLMLADKKKARAHAWRIPEATLMGVAVIGGSIGAIAGMRIFRHKTRHPKFRIGLPLILTVQILLITALVLIFPPDGAFPSILP